MKTNAAEYRRAKVVLLLCISFLFLTNCRKNTNQPALSNTSIPHISSSGFFISKGNIIDSLSIAVSIQLNSPYDNFENYYKLAPHFKYDVASPINRCKVDGDSIRKHSSLPIDSILFVIDSLNSTDTVRFDHFEFIDEEIKIYIGAVYRFQKTMQAGDDNERIVFSGSMEKMPSRSNSPASIDSESIVQKVFRKVDTVNCLRTICITSASINSTNVIMGTISLQKKNSGTSSYFIHGIQITNYRFAFLNDSLMDLTTDRDTSTFMGDCKSLPLQIYGRPIFYTLSVYPESDCVFSTCWGVKAGKCVSIGWEKLTVDSLK
jgi:hypothetical protein